MDKDKPIRLTKKDIELLSTYGCMVVNSVESNQDVDQDDSTVKKDSK